jgi:hypothetical protein
LSSAPLALAICVLLAASCGDESEPDRWTTAQAESITKIRGLPVRVRGCRGLGARLGARYLRFGCVAGARLRGERFDTVAVVYELRPSSPFRGSDSSYTLRDVHFVGGPGIP